MGRQPRVSRSAILTALLVALLPCFAPAVHAGPGQIDQVTILGLRRMTEEAAKHALAVDVGDPYDPAVLRARFKALWRMGLFESIRIEAEDGPEGGKVIVIRVEERSYLTSVDYSENSVLNRTQIEDRLRERKINIGLGKPIDLTVVGDVASVIRDYLAEKGHLDGKVHSDIQVLSDTTRAVRFDIIPGGKTRIRSIRFDGNEVFKDKKLRGQLKITEPRHWWWPWSAKNLYHPLKWDQDAINIRDLYQNAGYLDVRTKAPILEFGEEKKGAEQVETVDLSTLPTADDYLELWGAEDDDIDLATLTPKELEKRTERQIKLRKKAEKKADKERQKAQPKVKRWVDLKIPIVEGPQYRTGEVVIEGNEVFPDESLRLMVPLREGDILRQNWLDAGVEGITRRYEDRGHLYAEVVRQIRRRPDEPIADVTVTIDEDEPYYIDTIEFSGNTATQDRVMRREVLINEGALFNRTRLTLSQRKISQLGYIEAKEDPIIEPIEGENRVRVRFPVEEKGRNEIQVGGGYSGLEGAFFTGVYSTRNFLGRGQIVSLALQIGGRASRYQLSFTEPWFMNRPITLGFSIFRRDVDYGATLQSTSRGGGVILGKRLTTFTNVQLAYGYEAVTSNSLAFAIVDGGEVQQVSNETSNKISSLTPTFLFDKINNPYRPSAGHRFTASVQVAGGALGGDTAFIKPIVNYTTYNKFIGRSYLAVHAEAGMVREWGEGSTATAGTINGIPRSQRFWLGGDTQGPRVFESRTITPLRYVIIDQQGNIIEILGDPTGRPVEDFVGSGNIPVVVEVGGDRYFLLQTEIVYPFNEQADLALFMDAGDSLFEDQSFNFDTTRVAVGVELRFHLPVFPVPLRLIYGWPIRKLERDRTSSFTFSIGRSF